MAPVPDPSFTFVVKGDAPTDWESVALMTFEALVETLPFWVGSDWERLGSLGVQPAPRSKVRSAFVKGLTAERLRAAMHRPRKGVLTGLGVTFSPADWESSRGFPAVSIDCDVAAARQSVGSGFRIELNSVTGLASDGRFGSELLRLATALVGTVDRLTWAAGWVGWTAVPPFTDLAPYPRDREHVLGYDFVVCLTAEVLSHLGGLEAVASSPASLVEVAHTATGQECVVAVLAEALSAVDEDVLRSWKAFLGPVLDHSAPARRAEWVKDFVDRVPPADVLWQRPPMLLPEDWPQRN